MRNRIAWRWWFTAVVVAGLLGQVCAAKPPSSDDRGVPTIDERVTTLEAAVASLTTALEAANANIASLQDDLSAAESTITTLQISLAVAETKIVYLEEDVATATAAIGALEDQQAAQGATITALQSQQATQGTAITALQSEQETQNTDIADLQTQVAELVEIVGGGGADDGTVTDPQTTLMWQLATADTNGNGGVAEDDTLAWQEAIDYCEDLILCNDGTWTTDPFAPPSHGGVKYDDWRLPEIHELETLLDPNAPEAPYTWETFRPYTQSTWYWSSTSHATVPDEAWRVNFNVNNASNVYPYAKDSLYYVRAVRSGP